MLFSGLVFTQGCCYLSGAESRPWGGLGGGGRPGKAGAGAGAGKGRPGPPGSSSSSSSRPPSSRARHGPRQGSRAAIGAAAAGRSPSAPSGSPSGGPQQGGRGNSAGRVAVGLSGPLRRRRRSAGNKKPPPGQGQGAGAAGRRGRGRGQSGQVSMTWPSARYWGRPWAARLNASASGPAPRLRLLRRITATPWGQTSDDHGGHRRRSAR